VFDGLSTYFTVTLVLKDGKRFEPASKASTGWRAPSTKKNPAWKPGSVTLTQGWETHLTVQPQTATRVPRNLAPSVARGVPGDELA
jgi:hypothetical protein